MSVIAAGIAAGGAIAGGAISAGGTKKAAKAQQQARIDAAEKYSIANDKAIQGVQHGSYLNRYGVADVFGTKIDPNSAIYQPVDITDSQRDAITGNIQNLEASNELADLTNIAVDEQALSHLERILPGSRGQLGQISSQTTDYLNGEIPQDVREQILRETAGVGGQLGTPGTSAATMNRNLGLTSLDLNARGQSLFASMAQLANSTISPMQNQFQPQQSFLTPQERLGADIQQRENITQSNLNAAMLAAEEDPGAAGLYNQNLQAQLAAAGMLSGGNVGAGLAQQQIGASIGQASGLFGSILAGNRQQQGSGGGGYSTYSNNPTSYGSWGANTGPGTAQQVYDASISPYS